jgi:hypothetical protein
MVFSSNELQYECQFFELHVCACTRIQFIGFSYPSIRFAIDKQTHSVWYVFNDDTCVYIYVHITHSLTSKY